MPENRTKAASRRAGKSSKNGAARQSTLRRRQRAKSQPPAPAVAAASLSALTLTPRSGVEIYSSAYRLKPGNDNQLLLGLRESFRMAMEWKHSFADFPMLPPGLHGGTGRAIFDLIEDFSNRFTDEVTAAQACQEGNSFFFTLFRICETSYGWHVFSAKSLLEHVEATGNKSLYQLTLSFIKCFAKDVALPTWYNKGMAMAERWLEEDISEESYDLERGAADRLIMGEELTDEARAYQEYIDAKKSSLDSYRTGEWYKAGRQIEAAPTLSAEQMLRKVRAIRYNHPVKAAIIAGCRLMLEGYTLSQFSHFANVATEFGDAAPEDGLPYYNQFMITWDFESHINTAWTSFIDDLADNIGIHPAVYALRMQKHPGGKVPKQPSLEMVSGWPARLEKVFRLLFDASNHTKL